MEPQDERQTENFIKASHIQPMGEEFIDDAHNRLNGKGKIVQNNPKYKTVHAQLCQYAIKHVGHQINFENWNRELLDGYKRFRAKQAISINTIAKDVKTLNHG